MATKKELESFVRTIANMTLDGEIVDGEEFVMENDDAWSTVHSLVNQARDLNKAPAKKKRKG